MERQPATVIRSEELLNVEALTISVPGPHGYDIVRDVRLRVGSGEVLGLVGESGSGKTTLALALLGFARPGTEISGSVRIDGTEIIGAKAASVQRARGRLVSYVPQDPATALNPAMRIGSQLEEMLVLRRRDRRNLDRSRVEELLTKVRLPTSKEFLRRYPHQLSGGQLQRVSIAMAMLNRPRLIVFDEPTTGLDVTTQSRVLETIRELISTEDAAAVYVTHDLTVVGSIANRLGVMYSGLLVEEARTEAVLSRSAHPYSRRLVMATPSPSQRRELVGIPGAPLSPKDRGAGCPFADRCSFVEQQCLTTLPPFTAVETDHRSKCHRAEFVRSHAEGARPLRASIWQERSRAERAVEAAPVLAVSAMTAAYGEHAVLHDVSLSVSEGECLALVGESGSGKTTLARCVSGIHPDSVTGQLTFSAQSLAWTANRRPAAALREIQYIFQNPHASLNPRHTIGRIVAQPLKTFELVEHAAGRRARVRELLERVALPASYEHRYPSQLSGGERQRAAIARALAAQPRLLVCDEITSSLDVSIQASILELLGQLRQ
ncbi:MAG: peptide transporter ATP-binding protein, partial [Frankiales bacterium]|nr:peptide transporter ATP-binding protein [Frankiales bacterium]